jgi:hypothetical protein
MTAALQRSELGVTARKAVALARPVARQTLRERFAKGSVEWSPDLARVLALPRRTKPELAGIAEGLTQVLKRPGGQQTLREVQAWMLLEAPKAGGLVAAVQTGGGKTLPSFLMPMVWPWVQQADGSLRPPRCILLVPPSMRVQCAADWERYGQHWNLPNLAGGDKFEVGKPILHVIAYSELQQPKNSALLEQLQPDLIMGDEISCLKNFDSSRTTRARRYFSQRPDTAFCGWDATITSDSLVDFWHFLVWALSENAPGPIEEAEVRRWARAIDPEKFNDGYFLPGELMRFCAEGESVRGGFQRRLTQTLGIVTSEDQRLGIPLIFRERKPPPMPVQVTECLKLLRRPPAQGGWRRPDGEEFKEATEVVACARQLATGLYLRWRFPRGEPVELIEEWFEKRQAWNRELRAQLQSPFVHMDSPKLCENAAVRWYDGGCPVCTRGPQQDHWEGCREKHTHPLWQSYTYPAWREIEDKVYHETEAVWLSDWLLHDIVAWALEAPGIVWVEHPEVGERLARLSGLVYYGGGDIAAKELDAKYGDGSPRSKVSIICSVKAQSRGKNFQTSFWRSLIVSFPASNSIVEQLVGRTAREGQTASYIEVDYFLHTPELENALEKAKERGKYVHETLGQAQKLVWGTWA